MKTFTSIWFMMSVFVLPCTLNLERLDCCAVLLLNIVLSFIFFKKYNPEFINNN